MPLSAINQVAELFTLAVAVHGTGRQTCVAVTDNADRLSDSSERSPTGKAKCFHFGQVW